MAKGNWYLFLANQSSSSIALARAGEVKRISVAGWDAICRMHDLRCAPPRGELGCKRGVLAVQARIRFAINVLRSDLMHFLSAGNSR